MSTETIPSREHCPQAYMNYLEAKLAAREWQPIESGNICEGMNWNGLLIVMVEVSRGTYVPNRYENTYYTVGEIAEDGALFDMDQNCIGWNIRDVTSYVILPLSPNPESENT